MQEVSGCICNDIKFNFLIKANKDFKPNTGEIDLNALKTRIDDLKANLALNKQIVHSLIFPKSNDSLEDTVSESQRVPKTIEHLIIENHKLEENIEKTIEQRNDLQTKTLLNEQIYNEWTHRYNEISIEFQDQISELHFQNERKSKVLMDLQSFNNVLKAQVDIINKSKTIKQVKPSVDILKLHSKIEDIRELTLEKAREIYLFNTHKKQLEELKENLIKGIIKIQALTINPSNRKINADRNLKLEAFSYMEEKFINRFELSQIEKDFKKICFTEEIYEPNDEEDEVFRLKEKFKKKSKMLQIISEENLKQHIVNSKLVAENQKVLDKIEYIERCFFKGDVTTEIKKEYENSLCYKIKRNELDSISEIEVNHSNFYESSQSSKSISEKSY
ncbi:hypothetical protein SteCoe_28510 [Stentor coeruleus]|uniref:Uncharacterized protein n=1 Tax=Stentor coeruleus TaxID=5963 RepID=A0A1R2B820_9CILI|nr:hypothetical protein SteCoe_28510 [Stentor coeruleus]